MLRWGFRRWKSEILAVLVFLPQHLLFGAVHAIHVCADFLVVMDPASLMFGGQDPLGGEFQGKHGATLTLKRGVMRGMI